MTIKHRKFDDATLQITLMENLDPPTPQVSVKIIDRICDFQENSAEQDRDAGNSGR